MPDAAAPRAGGNLRRRNQEQYRPAPAHNCCTRFYQWGLRYPLAGAIRRRLNTLRRRAATSQRTRPPIHEITAQMLLRAYALGIFPMAERRDDDEIYWVDPEKRGIIPFDRFHLPRRLARTLRQQRFEVRCDENFDLVVGACSEPDFGRAETWI